MTYNERRVAAKNRLLSTSFLKPTALAVFLGVSAVSVGVPTLATAQSYAFNSVQIEGLNTIEADTVMAYLGFARGEAISAAELNDAYKRLAGAGLFDKVSFDPRGSTLVVKVTEFPIINRINVEGNKGLKDDALLGLLQSRPRYVYNPAQAEQDAETIAKAYADQGRIAAQVQPVIIRRPQNRVDLVFEVVEGKNSEIERITFSGNRAFSDARLRRVVSSKQAGILRFLISADTFDPGRAEFDKQLLKDFYASRGYVDFDAVAVTSQVAPQEDAFFVTFEVREGQQFSFGDISASSEIEGVDAAALEALSRIRAGTTYNPAVVDRAIARMEKRLQQDGYGFVRVDPRITRNERDGTLDVDFVVVRGPRIVVERIDIEGNTTTLDRVVRNRFTTVEGDPFNPREIRAAAERIRALGYFSNVDVAAREGSNPDSVVVDVNVEEQGTGAFSFGGTYALGEGAGVTLSFSERNFLGRGQYLNLEFSGGLDNANYALSFAEPFLFGRDLRFGFNGSYNESTWQDELFDTRAANAEASLEFPISETGRFKVGAGFDAATMINRGSLEDPPTAAATDPVAGAPSIINDEIARGWQYGVGANVGYSYDSTRTGLESDTTYFARVNAGVGGFGSDSRYLQASGLGRITTNLLGGDIAVSATVEGGAIHTISGAGTRITDRYMMSQDQVLGFASMGMGPRDLTTAGQEALGGNYFAAAQLEAKFPIGLPEEYGIKGGVFLTAGSVWGLDNPGLVDDSFHLRASGGVAVHWKTPIGPLRFSYAYPFLKESYDEEQRFGVSLSTGF